MPVYEHNLIGKIGIQKKWRRCFSSIFNKFVYMKRAMSKTYSHRSMIIYGEFHMAIKKQVINI